MKKADKTEQQLIDALDRLVAGKPEKSDGRITQSNIALEAGVSRATFNRYQTVVDEYRKVKHRSEFGELSRPFTLEEKNLELQESNTGLRRKLSREKSEYEQQLARARQEIYVLNMALQARDKTIAEKDRAVAELKRKLADQGRSIPSHLGVVR